MRTLRAGVPAEKRERFQQAVQAYRANDPKRALEQLNAFLATRPTPSEALELISDDGEQALYEMLGKEPFSGLAATLLALSLQQREILAVDPVKIRTVVHQCLLPDPKEGLPNAMEAQTRLARIGEAAAPVLVEMLVNTREPSDQARILSLMESVGPDMLMPLAESLSIQDPALRNALLGVVGRILARSHMVPSSKRAYAVACVQQIRQDAQAESADLRRTADQVLSDLQVPADASAANLFLAASEELFQSEAPRFTTVRLGALSVSLAQVWRWSQKGKNLVPVHLVQFGSQQDAVPGFIPSFAYNEIASQTAALRALRLDPRHDAALAQYIFAIVSELAENRDLQAHAIEHPEIQILLEPLKIRETELQREMTILQGAGPRVLAGALQRALERQETGSCTLLTQILGDMGRGISLPAHREEYQQWRSAGRVTFLPASANGEKRGKTAPLGPGQVDSTPLLSALESQNPAIQYQAALALARIDPVKPFHGRERVVELLSRAVGDVPPRVVLVVSPDSEFANAASSDLRALGYSVVTAFDGMDAVKKAREFPSKDAILLDHLDPVREKRLAASLQEILREHPRGFQKTREIYETLSNDFRTQQIPVWVALPADDGAARDSYPPDKVAGFLGRPLSQRTLEAGLAKVLNEKSKPKSWEQVSLLAAAALGGMDPARSVFAEYLPQAARVLAEAARGGSAGKVTPPDAHRIAYLAALERIGTPGETLACLQIATHPQEQPNLRVAALRALGAILGSSPSVSPEVVRALTGLLSDGSEPVRNAAGWALGRSRVPTEAASAILLNREEPAPAPARAQ